MTESSTSTSDQSLPDHIQNFEEYQRLYRLSIENPNLFWKMAAARLTWYRFPTQIKNTEFDYRSERGVEIKWYEDGVLNVCYNCLDRHLENDSDVANQVAVIFETDIQNDERHHVTYGQLLDRVKKFANVLKKHGVKKGDRVTIYMPMIVDTCVAMLACARIGAIHSVVFGGFSANSVAERISDCDSSIVLTSDFGVRGGKLIPLKSKIDQALKMSQCQSVKTVLVFERTHEPKRTPNDRTISAEWVEGRDFWVHEELEKVDHNCPCEPMNAEDPLFIVSTALEKANVPSKASLSTHSSSIRVVQLVNRRESCILPVVI